MQISGKTNKQFGMRNFVQLSLESRWIEYIHKIEKYQISGVLDDMLSDEKNIELYEVLSEKHNNTIFNKKPNPIGEKLNSGKEKFIKLDLKSQIKILSEIIKLTSVGIVSGDLSLIGGAAIAGKILISKNITDSKECMLINQSITGLYENRIDLLRV